MQHELHLAVSYIMGWVSSLKMLEALNILSLKQL